MQEILEQFNSQFGNLSTAGQFFIIVLLFIGGLWIGAFLNSPIEIAKELKKISSFKKEEVEILKRIANALEVRNGTASEEKLVEEKPSLTNARPSGAGVGAVRRSIIRE